MKSLLVIALFMGSVAHAHNMQTQGFFQEIAPFFDAIIDEFGKHNNKGHHGNNGHHGQHGWTSFDKEGELILKNRGEKIVFGKVFLENYRDEDTIRLPRCNRSNNHRVRNLQLRIRRQSAFINGVVIIFGNGESKSLGIHESFNAGEDTRWINVDYWSHEGRCIREIRITGNSQSSGSYRSVVRAVGNNNQWNNRW